MENKKITNIQDLIDILEFYKRNNNFGKFNKEDIYKSAFEIISRSERFGVLEEKDISKWNADQLKGALELIRQDTLSTTPQKEALEKGQKLAGEQKEARREAEATAKKETEKTIETAKKIAAQKKTTVYAVPSHTPEAVRLETKTIEKIEASKKDVNSFVTDFVEFSSKSENLPDGINIPTAKAVALATATDLVTEKLPAVTIKDNEAVPLPNKLAAQVALLSEKSKLENSVSPEDKELVAKYVAVSTAHDAVWREVQKRMVDQYFGANTSTVIYGDPNQTYQISETPSGGKESLQIDIESVVNQASNLQETFSQPPEKISSSIVEGLRGFENFPRPDIAGFSQNLSNLTRGIVDLFGKAPTGELSAPSMNQLNAMRYLDLIPEFRFISPELALLTRDVQILTVPLKGLPFGLPAGQLGVNVSLLQGVNFSFLPAAGAEAAGAAGAAAGTAAGAATTGAVAAGEAVTGAAVTTAAATTGGAATAVGLGSIINPIVGAVVGIVIALWPKIQEFFGKIKDWLAGLGLAAFGLGLLVGNIPLMGAGGVAMAAGFASGATPSSLASGLATLAGASIGSVFAEIAAPLIGTIIGFPLVVAFILFIINSGAYVVPPGGSAYGIGLNAGTTATGSCPISGSAVITTASYNPIAEKAGQDFHTAGHGSNDYWGNKTPCIWEIPIAGMYSSVCKGPSPDTPNYNPDNACSGQPTANLCPFYGFAIDVVPGDQKTIGAPVYLPYLCQPGETSCPPVKWTLANSFYNCGGSSNAGANKEECAAHGGATNGYGLIFDGVGSDGQTWRIYLTHVDPVITTDSSVSYESGTQVAVISGDLSSGWHVHIELDQEGRPIRPDFLCSGAGISGGTVSAPISVGVEGYVVEAPISSTNVIVSPQSEYGRKTCDWASGKGLFASVNANYFDALTAPIGPAGFNGVFTSFMESEQAKKYKLVSFSVSGSSGQIISTYDLDYESKNFNSVVTGIRFDSAKDEIRPRTVLGIKDGKLLLAVLKNATPSKAEEVMKTLGATQAFLLDGGSSSTFCQGSTPLFAGGTGGQQSTVSVNIGVKAGVMHQLTK